MKSKTESKTEAETPIGHPAHKRWGRNVEVRVATAAEHEWFDAQLHDRHYLEPGIRWAITCAR